MTDQFPELADHARQFDAEVILDGKSWRSSTGKN